MGKRKWYRYRILKKQLNDLSVFVDIRRRYYFQNQGYSINGISLIIYTINKHAL